METSVSRSFARVEDSSNYDEHFLAPPSYREAMDIAVQLNEEGEHPIGSRPFNPMYPVFNFNRVQPYTPLNNNSPTGAQPYGFVGETSNTQQTAPGSISDSAIIQKY